MCMSRGRQTTTPAPAPAPPAPEPIPEETQVGAKRKAEEEKGVVIHTGPPEDSTCLSLADMGLFLE